MRILHVSDLHALDPKDLNDLWTSLEMTLTQNDESRLDAIVVAGDLSNTARAGEYQKSLDFVKRRVLGLVGGDPNKVVIVPGNHDVDWHEERITWPLDFSRRSLESGESFLREKLAEERKWYGKSKLRLEVTPSGHVQWLVRANIPDYHRRFRNFQSQLLDPFYEHALEANGGKTMNLLGQDAEHWSAHIFPELQCAIFGFNSCSRTDKHWTGAEIHHDAIESAERFIHEKCKDKSHPLSRDYVFVAIWHHGVTSDNPTRPDHIQVKHVTRLHQAGFHIGMHGHTHKGDSVVKEIAGGQMVVVSVGGLGAPSEHRPNAKGSQFGITTLNRHFVRVDVFEADRGGPYLRKPKQITLLNDPGYSSRKLPNTVVRTHRRSWYVEKRGLTKLTVSLDGIRGEKDDVPLLYSEMPWGDVRYTEHPEITRNVAGKRYLIRANTKLSRFSHDFFVSNAIALNQAELELRPPKRNVNNGLECVAHMMMSDCDRFELSVELPGIDEICSGMENCQIFVETKDGPDPGHHMGNWRRDTRSETALTNADCLKVLSPYEVQLVVPEPVVGRRYGVTFRPKEKGRKLPVEVIEINNTIIRACTQSNAGKNLRGDIVSGLLQHIQLHYNLDTRQPIVGKDTNFVVYLWDHSERCLTPVCGIFPPSVWLDRFPHGRGIVGQAFRFGDAPGHESWTRERTDSPHYWFSKHERFLRDDYSWIVAIPTYMFVKGSRIPVGVVGIAGRTYRTPFETQICSALARSSDRPNPFLSDLSWLFHAAFCDIFIRQRKDERLLNEDEVQLMGDSLRTMMKKCGKDARRTIKKRRATWPKGLTLPKVTRPKGETRPKGVGKTRPRRGGGTTLGATGRVDVGCSVDIADRSMMTTKRLTEFSWLHVSDLHEGHRQEHLWANIGGAVRDDLQKLAVRTGPWDVVFFTGDLVQRGERKLYDRLSRKLAELWNFFDVQMGFCPALFTVPGNHDIKWQDPLDPNVIAVSKLHDVESVRDAFWSDRASGTRRIVQKAFSSYSQWQRGHSFPRLPHPASGLLPGDSSAILTKDGVRLGVVGLNSAAVQLTSGDHLGSATSPEGPYCGRIALDVRQLHAVCGGDGHVWTQDNVDFALLLTHHPPSWFHPLSMDNYETEIYPPGRFVAHLFGHMHEHEFRSRGDGGAVPRRHWQATSLFGLETRYGQVDRRHGFTAGKLVVDGKDAYFRLWPRTAVRKAGRYYRLEKEVTWELLDDEGTAPVHLGRRHVE